MPVTIPQAPRAALSVPRHVLVVLRQITVRPVTQHKTWFSLEYNVFVQLVIITQLLSYVNYAA
jgi:hypothetical protein